MLAAIITVINVIVVYIYLTLLSQIKYRLPV